MKISIRALCFALSVLMLFGVFFTGLFAASEETPATSIPDRLPRVFNKYTVDFSDTAMSAYIRNKALSIDNRTAMKFTDGRLSCGAQSFSFGSSCFLGDDYGLSEGYVQMTLSITSGKISIGARLSRTGSYPDDRGVWFSFAPGNVLYVTEPESGISAEITHTADISKPVTVRLSEKLDSLQLYINGSLVCRVDYSSDGRLNICDKDGKAVTSTDKCGLYGGGYVAVCFEGGTEGYIDDFEFTHYSIDQTQPSADMREIDYSTWVATDDLERSVAGNETAGDVKDNKYVGMFYFLCWVGAGVHVYDNTAIYLESGVDGLKKHLEAEGGESYWAEPFFGYYRNTDTWVYRKHAYMLEAAGVDFIFLDVSNAVTFDEGHTALFDTWLQIRKEGGMTPQIVFFCGDTVSTFDTDISHLSKTVYAPQNYDKYKELFFMWEGKPLIFGNINDGKNKINAESEKFLEGFTVRGNWAWCDKDGYWSWLQEYDFNDKNGTYKMTSGGKGRDINGKFEELSICLGHHASTSKGRSYYYGDQPNTKEKDFCFSLETSGDGICFKSQFDAAMSYDPSVLLITGWNEWIAGCFHDKSQTYFAGTPVKGYVFVDQFNTEFSRDAEPMRLRDGVGFGDNYYYQLCDYVRQFKGISEASKATGQKSVKLTDITTWDSVQPEYRDNTGDVELRNTVCYDAAYRYINNTGRNDFDYAKVSQDADYMYFMVKCTSDIQRADGENFMNLFIDIDRDHKTGWEGYDYVINRSRTDNTVSVEKFNGNDFTSAKIADAAYFINGEYMVVRIAKADLQASEITQLYFKWSDNSTTSGNVMDFMDLGDAAPNDRYAYSYIGYAGETIEYPDDTSAPSATDTVPSETVAPSDGEEDLTGFIIMVAAVATAVIIAAVIIVVIIKRR